MSVVQPPAPPPCFPQGVFPTMITPFTGQSYPPPSPQRAASSYSPSAAGSIDVPVLKALTDWRAHTLHALFFCQVSRTPQVRPFIPRRLLAIKPLIRIRLMQSTGTLRRVSVASSQTAFRLKCEPDASRRSDVLRALNRLKVRFERRGACSACAHCEAAGLCPSNFQITACPMP